MSNIVPAFSTIRVTLTAAQLLATWSKGAYKTTQVNAYVNAPPSNAQLLDVPAGSLMQQSSAFTNGATVDIDAYGGLPVFYEQGTAATVKEGRFQQGIQIASTTQNATATLTSTQLLNGRIISNGTTNPSELTLPTGTLLYAATSWVAGEYFDWSLQNTGANVVNVLAGTDHTIIGGSGSTISVATLVTAYLRTTCVSFTAAGVGTFTTEVLARPVT